MTDEAGEESQMLNIGVGQGPPDRRAVRVQRSQEWTWQRVVGTLATHAKAYAKAIGVLDGEAKQAKGQANAVGKGVQVPSREGTGRDGAVSQEWRFADLLRTVSSYVGLGGEEAGGEQVGGEGGDRVRAKAARSQARKAKKSLPQEWAPVEFSKAIFSPTEPGPQPPAEKPPAEKPPAEKRKGPPGRSAKRFKRPKTYLPSFLKTPQGPPERSAARVQKNGGKPADMEQEEASSEGRRLGAPWKGKEKRDGKPEAKAAVEEKAATGVKWEHARRQKAGRHKRRGRRA
jgi:hypothetical protein